MKILLTGSTGGIGSAIKEVLKGHELIEFNRADADFTSSSVDITKLCGHDYDWLVFAHGTISEEDIADTFMVNTLSCIALTMRFLPERGVIFISSTAALKGNGLFPVYAASKGALNVFAESLSRKFETRTFVSICPGPTNTQMWKNLALAGEAQDTQEVARAVKRVISGEFKSGGIITVRNGEITCL